MARPELPGAAAPHSAACFSISVGGSHPLFQSPAKNALLFFVLLWYIGLEIVKAALKSSIFLFFLEQLCYFNLSPQGDGNSLVPLCTKTRANFNLSPQGDGNLSLPSIFQMCLHFNLSPQGDGNHDLIKGIVAVVRISTYPRKGTETDLLQHSHSFPQYFNLSPQGGKKLRTKNGAEFFFCVP